MREIAAVPVDGREALAVGGVFHGGDARGVVDRGSRRPRAPRPPGRAREKGSGGPARSRRRRGPCMPSPCCRPRRWLPPRWRKALRASRQPRARSRRSRRSWSEPSAVCPSGKSPPAERHRPAASPAFPVTTIFRLNQQPSAGESIEIVGGVESVRRRRGPPKTRGPWTSFRSAGSGRSSRPWRPRSSRRGRRSSPSPDRSTARGGGRRARLHRTRRGSARGDCGRPRGAGRGAAAEDHPAVGADSRDPRSGIPSPPSRSRSR